MNLGAGEVFLLVIIALLLFGPKRLPEIGRQVGRALAEVKRVSREFEREVREVTEPFEREIRDALEPVDTEVRQLEAEARKTYAVDDDYSTFVTPAEPPHSSASPEQPKDPAQD